MVEIGNQHAHCRYWGYEIAACEIVRNMRHTNEEREAARKAVKSSRETIKALALKSSLMGQTKEKAIAQATHVEERTGVQMRVFNHDYL